MKKNGLEHLNKEQKKVLKDHLASKEKMLKPKKPESTTGTRG